MSASPRFPPEVWHEIVSFVHPPSTKLVRDPTSFLPEILSWRDDITLPKLRDEIFRDVASLRLVSKTMCDIASSAFWSTIHIYSPRQGVAFIKLLQSRQIQETVAPAFAVRALVLHTDLWDDEGWDELGVQQDHLAVILAYLPNLVSLHLNDDVAAPSSIFSALAVLGTPLRTLTGVALDSSNINSFLSLLAPLATTMEVLQVVQVNPLVVARLPSAFDSFSLVLPRLRELSTGPSFSGPVSFGPSFQELFASRLAISFLSKLSVATMDERRRWGGGSMGRTNFANSNGLGLVAFLGSERLETLLSDHRELQTSSPDIQEVVIRISNKSSSKVPLPLSLAPIGSVSRIILVPIPQEDGQFKSSKNEARLLAAYVSKEVFPGLVEVLYVETCPKSSWVWKPWHDLSLRLLKDGVDVRTV